MKKYTLKGIIATAMIALMTTGSCRSQRHASADNDIRLNHSTTDSSASLAVTAMRELMTAHTGTVIDSPVITVTSQSGLTVSLKATRLSSNSLMTRETNRADSTSTIRTATGLETVKADIHKETDTKTSAATAGTGWWLLGVIALACWWLGKRGR